MATRHAFVGHLKPACRAEYLRLHQAVWPDVLALISRTGITDYTVWNHGDLLFATYLFTGDDHDARVAEMIADPVMVRWWAVCVPCFVASPSGPWATMDLAFALV